MRKGRTFTLLAVAALLAVLAGGLANSWIKARLSSADKAGGTVPVIVAAIQMPFGHIVEVGDVKVVRMPSGAFPRSSFHDTKSVVGRVTTQKILPEEILLQDRVVPHGAGSALAAVISPDKRAVTVRVNDVIGVAGFLLPGNRVDVVASRRARNRKVVSHTLLQDIKVLAVDQTASPDKDKPIIVRAVTLETTPDQAEQLVKATQEGSVQLTLRNPLTDKPVANETKTTVDSKPRPRRVARHRYVPLYVTIIRGTSVERVRVKE